MRARNKREKYERIMEKKMTTTYDELTKDIPKEFGLFLKYSRNLEFEDQPRYNYLRDLMREIAVREDIIIDNQFDWL
jgi:casein kinase I family protein HRR25